MSSLGILAVIVVAGLTIVGAGIAVFMTRIYRRVDQGRALIVNTTKEAKVTFHGAYVLPVFHRAEMMDISLKTIEIDRRGKEGLICQDNIRADIKVTFFVRVNQTESDVLRVAQSVGCDRASDPLTIEELFGAKFSEALKTVGKQLDFEDLYKERDNFRDRIINAIGDDLNGYVLEDAAIDYLEQTPVTDLDPNNILDAQGIKKITELTATQKVKTQELNNKAAKEIGKDNLDTKVAMLAYERDEREEEARQQRHIAIVQAKERADAEEARAGELAREETAKIEASEKINVRKINAARIQEVANKNRERDVAVETEKVERERQLAMVAREREVTLEQIAKDKEVEVERKLIADVVRDRIAVDKTVAAEEESIKELRLVSEADRKRKADIITAEADAEKQLIADIKAAEAQRAAAEHQAKQLLIEADAELQAASKLAEAKQRVAEGVQAEEAASGLAIAQVKEADAIASEKQGMVDAKVLRAKSFAQAEGKQALVEALEKEGLAQAEITRQELMAKADGEREVGIAEATAVREKMVAEASGIEAKADAMKKLDAVTRDHEEFRLRLEQDRILSIERIKSGIEIAKAQAATMSEAVKAANINIVGGDGAFYENFIKSVSVGHMVEGLMDNSPTAKKLLGQVSERIGGKGNVDAGQLMNALTDLLETVDSDDEKMKVLELIEKVDPEAA